MTVVSTESLPLRNEQDIVRARQTVRKLSQSLGFGLVDQTKIVTATSELARNAVVYGLGGTMSCEIVRDGARTGLRLQFVDEGPGIPDVAQAMVDWACREPNAWSTTSRSSRLLDRVRG
jgi:serine/threonine-protein kinase RsbT